MKFHISGPKIIFFVLALCATVMIMTSSFFNVLYDSEFYTAEFTKLSEQISVSEPEIKTQAILSYFSNSEEKMYQSEVVFTDKKMTDDEVSLLETVKIALKKIKRIYFISFGFFFVLLFGFLSGLFIKYKREKQILKEKFTLFFIKLEMYVLVITTSLVLLMSVISHFMFYKIQAMFYWLFFQSKAIVLSSDSILLSLFPNQFFSDFVSSVILVSVRFIVLLAILLGIFYLTYVLRQPKQKRLEHKQNVKVVLSGKDKKITKRKKSILLNDDF